MKILIKNVGIIGETFLDCDGITIITGKNGSGKTTIAKSVTSILSVFSNNHETWLSDCREYFKNQLSNVYDELCFFTKRRSVIFNDKPRSTFENSRPIFEMPSVEMISDGRFPDADFEELVLFVRKALDELETNKEKYFELYSGKNVKKQQFIFSDEMAVEIYDTCIRRTIDSLENIEKYSNSKKYLFESIKNQLNYSFHGQLIPVDRKSSEPSICIYNNNGSIEYFHNSYDSFKADSLGDLKNVFYIFDGSVIDQIDSFKKRAKRVRGDNMNTSVLSMDEILLSAISTKKNIMVSDNIIDKNKEIFGIINSVWPHDIIKQKGITINSNTGLNISNEASGAKIFIIIKLLLMNGYINRDTLLFFDEPENHLHPEWQAQFAKLIININKSIGTKIICITHSQTMLLAFDVFSKKLKNKDKTKFYFGESKNGISNFIDLSEDIPTMHRKLTDPYVFMGYELLDEKD